MCTAITQSELFVPDQDEALDFYVGKLEFEVTAFASLEPRHFMHGLELGGHPRKSSHLRPHHCARPTLSCIEHA